MKKLVSLALAVMMIFVLAACSKPDPAPVADPTPAAPDTPSTPAETDPATPAEPDGYYATSTDKYDLKFAVTPAENTAWAMGAQKLADIVAERTNGNVKITVYANETLAGGNQSKGVEMIMQGVTDLDAHSNIIYTVMNESYGVASLPFMYKNEVEAYDQLMGPAGDYYRDLLEKDGLVLLGFGENGMRQLTTNKAINSVEDLKGQKIRVPGMQILLAVFEKLGCNPISMNFAEVFTALQQGAIDGQENPYDIIQGNMLYEVQDYLILWNYCYDCLFYTINKNLFDSMPADYQQIILEAGAEATKYQVELARSRADEQLKFFEENGMTIIRPTEEAAASYKEAGDYMKELYRSPDKFGAELIDLFTPAS
ncbi:DctP family TRAP transporter solute-binding subunit [Eubacteriales bacterium OttesenSCG-928-K08]|nr:DctP family TRAP transporter solute-binding subunit [Eubacteriales bacterium OttesenSCG-928-K08]